MISRRSPRRELRDAYRFPGFVPNPTVVGVFGDPRARVSLTRRAKTVCGTRGTAHRTWYDRTRRRVRDLPCGDPRIHLEFELRRVDCRRCGGVKRERFDWLAANQHDTKRFALYVGKQCRSASIQEVAEDLHLDWHAVKEMDKLYLREQLARAGEPRPAVIGIDEISIRKRHVDRIVVSDLERAQPIWFGGVGGARAPGRDSV